MLQLFVYLPATFLLIDFFLLNRLELAKQHVVFPVATLLMWLGMTAFSQFAFGNPLYPSALDWTFPDATRSGATAWFLFVLIVSVFALYFIMFSLLDAKAYCLEKKAHTKALNSKLLAQKQK